MRKILLASMIIFMSICGEWSSLGAAEEAGAVKVGVILPLSGEFAAWGEGIRRGIQLFADTKKRTFKFDFQDEGNCQAQKALSAYRRFIGDGIKYVIVGCLAGTKAILPVAKNKDVVLFSVGLLDDAAFKQTDKLINLATQLSTESYYLAHRVAQQGFKRVAIVHWIDAFSEEFAATLRNTLAQLDVEVVSQNGVDPKDRDYRSLLLRIKTSKPDAICYNIGQDQQEVLLRQIRQLGLNLAVFSNYVFETPPVLKLGNLTSNVEYSFPLNSAEGTPEKIEYDKRFSARFGASSTPIANTYFVRDGLVLLETAVSKCGSGSADCVNKFFKNTSGFEGLSGEVSFRPDGSNMRPYGIKRIKNGEFIWADKKISLEDK